MPWPPLPSLPSSFSPPHAIPATLASLLFEDARSSSAIFLAAPSVCNICPPKICLTQSLSSSLHFPQVILTCLILKLPPPTLFSATSIFFSFFSNSYNVLTYYIIYLLSGLLSVSPTKCKPSECRDLYLVHWCIPSTCHRTRYSKCSVNSCQIGSIIPSWDAHMSSSTFLYSFFLSLEVFTCLNDVLQKPF